MRDAGSSFERFGVCKRHSICIRGISGERRGRLENGEGPHDRRNDRERRWRINREGA